MILESIWEADFYDESIGYRQGVGARQSSKDLAEALNDGTYRWVVEADIRGFFDHIDHGWMVRMLEQRIADRPLIRLIVKWLKAGVMETDGRVVNPTTGTPQGGVISPILANIYLHYVQDQWIKKVVSKRSKGRVLFRRYADDSVVCFERQDDAQTYLRDLPKRLEKFNLQIAEEKSSLVKFQPLGAGSKREVYLPWIRLLLGARAKVSSIRQREAENQPKEIPSQFVSPERMVEESTQSEAA